MTSHLSSIDSTDPQERPEGEPEERPGTPATSIEEPTDLFRVRRLTSTQIGVYGVGGTFSAHMMGFVDGPMAGGTLAVVLLAAIVKQSVYRRRR
ncbi:hypothetical protein ACFYW6_34070 [Streptomyces sp. NPDC002659]|uniref:hypothetical protein n=1 Tax=Streptomyces sp. NPDC002659 TaxID=3364656 RepID=UPI003675D227